ncbi:MAG TPA: LysM peptidoglycan-binding domain-containing protein, partial [Phenylobacterium sp.]
MTHLFERTALILLVSTALGVSTGAGGAFAQPVLDIPAAKAEQAQVGQDSDVFARSKSRGHKASGPAATYKVKKGDTLAEVADKLGTSIEALAKANGLKSPYRLTPGRTLKNPAARKGEPVSAKGSRKTGSQAASESYVVKSGDTLFSISKKFGVSVADLKAANGLGRSNSIARGRKLSIPGAGGAEAAEEAPPPR